MPTLIEIESQIRNLDGIETLLGRREIKELPNILWADEIIENAILGMYNDGFGVLVATNKRLVFVDKGVFFGLKVEDFPYDKISSIQYETGLFYGKMTIFTSGNKAEIERVLKSKVRKFGDWVRARITAPMKNAIQESINKDKTIPSGLNIIDQLERLAQLRDLGILTEDEFNLGKKKLLSQ